MRATLHNDQMQAVSNDNFGPLIAYLVPGATVLVGMSNFSPTLQGWFASSPLDSPTIGGFLYLSVAAIAAGMTVSALRWAFVDTVHAWSGLQTPSLDFSRLGENVDAFVLLIEIHYRHYQFYANMLVATAIAYGCHRVGGGHLALAWSDLAFVGLESVFYATSRDTLAKYYARSQQLLASATTTINGPTCENQSPEIDSKPTSGSGGIALVAQQTPAESAPMPGRLFEVG